MALVIFTSTICNAQNVGIGTTTPTPSAQLDVSSNNKGFLPPRLTNIERNSIASPVAGLIIWNTDCGELQVYSGVTWTNMIGGIACFNFLPIVTTAAPSDISYNTATCGGNVTADGGFSVTARGVVWDTLHNPTIALNTKTLNDTGLGLFTSSLTNLLNNRTYYVRAYATNSAATTYGNEESFTTLSPPGFDTVTICNQLWMRRNLDVVTYKNGDTIPQVTDPNVWAGLATGAWCWYNNDSATYAATYGRLYNGYAVNDSRGLAPEGWHVATENDWTLLDNCAGGGQTSGGKLKEAGTVHWLSPNTGATNSTGFTALPGGLRYYDGGFSNITRYGHFWTSTAWIQNRYYMHALGYDYEYLFGIDRTQNYGYSVRCVKD